MTAPQVPKAMATKVTAQINSRNVNFRDLVAVNRMANDAIQYGSKTPNPRVFIHPSYSTDSENKSRSGTGIDNKPSPPIIATKIIILAPNFGNQNSHINAGRKRNNPKKTNATNMSGGPP